MSLEEKFGEPLTAADTPFFDTAVMAPQTVGVVSRPGQKISFFLSTAASTKSL